MKHRNETYYIEKTESLVQKIPQNSSGRIHVKSCQPIQGVILQVLHRQKRHQAENTI